MFRHQAGGEQLSAMKGKRISAIWTCMKGKGCILSCNRWRRDQGLVTMVTGGEGREGLDERSGRDHGANSSQHN